MVRGILGKCSGNATAAIGCQEGSTFLNQFKTLAERLPCKRMHNDSTMILQVLWKECTLVVWHFIDLIIDKCIEWWKGCTVIAFDRCSYE